MLKAWIAASAPYTPGREAAVERLEVIPTQAVLAKRGETIQIKIVAHYADKSKEDVTGLTQVAVHRCSRCASQVRCARTTTRTDGQPSAPLATVPVCHPPRAG
jgi:hypothetical protein